MDISFLPKSWIASFLLLFHFVFGNMILFGFLGVSDWNDVLQIRPLTHILPLNIFAAILLGYALKSILIMAATPKKLMGLSILSSLGIQLIGAAMFSFFPPSAVGTFSLGSDTATGAFMTFVILGFLFLSLPFFLLNLFFFSSLNKACHFPEEIQRAETP